LLSYVVQHELFRKPSKYFKILKETSSALDRHPH
jgi:hypothetical protein